MISKKVKISLFIISIIIAFGFAYIIFPFHGIPTILSTTVEDTPFQEIELEKDSSISTNMQKDSIKVFDSITHKITYHHFQKHNSPVLKNDVKSQTSTSETSIKEIEPIPKKTPIGKELLASDFKQMYSANTRVRFTEFFNTFRNGDYISGKEFSGIYRRDPTLNKVAKSTICSFIEKNIKYISRKDNSLIIHTLETNGIHTKLKIPFVEDLRINIENGSSIDIGKTFSSTEPAFVKSILMPIKLNEIDIVHNGEEFPKSGFISGNYYFIDYSKTKMAYKIR